MGHTFPVAKRLLILLGVGVTLFAGCAAPQITEGLISVTILADGEELSVDIPAGSTADDVLRAGGILLESLDRTEPPLYTVLGEGSQVRVTRVTEEFIVEQEVIPFESQIVRNESLPEGQEYWLQLGENGLREITIRRVFEDGEEISSNPVKSIVIDEPVPQIKMVGVQKSFVPFVIPGKLAYLVDGDAWIMEETTGNRQLVVPSGDLDGRVFSLSPDGNWLLFTRTSEDEDIINVLWVVPLEGESSEAIDLEVSNIIHFADWKPDSAQTIAYSTVEPRPGAPGWQANNDLQLLTFSDAGFVNQLPAIIDTNSGGLYGWWGSDFKWAPEGQRLSYARPDQIGLVDLQAEEVTVLKEFQPIQTFGDWAWVPGINWGPGGDILYGVDPQLRFDIPIFNLEIIPVPNGVHLVLSPEVGMFSYPVPSPSQNLPSGERSHQIAFLKAVFPNQSETSRYNLMVMDRDGSNKRVLFPLEGAEGLEPQEVVWSPSSLDDSENLAIAFIFENNLWIVDSISGEAWQITGDGLTTNIDWK